MASCVLCIYAHVPKYVTALLSKRMAGTGVPTTTFEAVPRELLMLTGQSPQLRWRIGCFQFLLEQSHCEHILKCETDSWYLM